MNVSLCFCRNLLLIYLLTTIPSTCKLVVNWKSLTDFNIEFYENCGNFSNLFWKLDMNNLHVIWRSISISVCICILYRLKHIPEKGKIKFNWTDKRSVLFLKSTVHSILKYTISKQNSSLISNNFSIS